MTTTMRKFIAECLSTIKGQRDPWANGYRAAMKDVRNALAAIDKGETPSGE